MSPTNTQPRPWLALLLALPLGACGLIDEAKQAVENVRNTIDQVQQQLSEPVSEDELNQLVSLASSSSEAIGNRLSQATVRQGRSTSLDEVGGGAPVYFQPAQDDDSSDDCVEVSESTTIIIENYNGCSDRSGQIKYELTPPEEGALKMVVTFTGYAEGASDSTDHQGIDGETVWSMVGAPAGFLILSKEQVTLSFNRETTQGVETRRLQSNNLWTYTMNFEQGELVINTTAAFIDLDTFNTSVLDFQEVTFQDPSNPASDCPTGLVDGKASLKRGQTTVSIDVTGCSEGELSRETTEETTDRTLDGDGLDAVFGQAVENFVRLINDIEGADVRQTLEGESAALGADCSTEAIDDPIVDPLLGTWCTAWPAAYDGNNRPQTGGPAWLECWRFCRQGGATHYERFGGVADDWRGPDVDYQAKPYYLGQIVEESGVTPDGGPPLDLPPADFAPVCRDFVWETGTLRTEDYTRTFARALAETWEEWGGAAAGDPANPYSGGYAHGRAVDASIYAEVFAEFGHDEPAGDGGDTGSPPPGGEQASRIDMFEVQLASGYDVLDWWIPGYDDELLDPTFPEFVAQSFRNDKVPTRRCEEADYQLVEGR